jgi:hypothetical protein
MEPQSATKLARMLSSNRMICNPKAILRLCALALYICGTRWTVAQSPTENSPDQFLRYPAKHFFKGHPAAPILTTPDAHLFRTRIREGVAKGVVFGGHYELAVWGCGSGCLSFAVIDAFTGKVTFFPASVSQNREAGERLTYRRDSMALHIIGSLNDVDSADRWYEWNGNEFVLISKKPAVFLDDNGDPIKP